MSSRPGVPKGETTAAASGLALYAVALWLRGDVPGPGALALMCGLACLHGALLAPACGPRGGWGWAFVPLLLAVPALAATSYGHSGPGALLRAGGFAALACLAGAVPRVLDGRAGARLYLPLAALAFALPPVLRYLVLEFRGAAGADAWGLLSPFAAARPVTEGTGWPWPATLLLLAWPVWALAARGLRLR